MRLALNKNSLKQQRDHLAMYRRFLPSLDLKRQQLLGAWKESRVDLDRADLEVSQYRENLDRLLPLLGSTSLREQDLSPLVRVKQVVIEEENVVGAKVPVVRAIEFERQKYSTLVLPFWVDQLIECVEQMSRLRVQRQVAEQRVRCLRMAARKITQRVNLFEKVLIPEAKQNIKRIQLALSDEERSAVVRSKIAKRKHEKTNS